MTIPKTDLIEGRYYFGEGRLGDIAMWDGKQFLAFGFDCGRWMEQYMEYGDKGFTPKEEIMKKN